MFSPFNKYVVYICFYTDLYIIEVLKCLSKYKINVHLNIFQVFAQYFLNIQITFLKY